MTGVSAPIREDEPATRRKGLAAMPARMLPGRLLRLARSLILVPWLLPLLVTASGCTGHPAALGASDPAVQARRRPWSLALCRRPVTTAARCAGRPRSVQA